MADETIPRNLLDTVHDFEQGRDIQVSESFPLKIAKALRLDDWECSRLFLLAHRRPPPPEAYQWPSVTPLVQQLLDDLARPAYVINLGWDVIAWNATANALFGFADLDQHSRNILRLVFADPDIRPRLPRWKENAASTSGYGRLIRRIPTAPSRP